MEHESKVGRTGVLPRSSRPPQHRPMEPRHPGDPPPLDGPSSKPSDQASTPNLSRPPTNRRRSLDARHVVKWDHMRRPPARDGGSNKTYFGALVGRVANRIAGARFHLNGHTYKLFPNDGNNTIHGGKRGFSHVIWSVERITGGKHPSITYCYHSFDGEEGYPGDLDVYVTYKITDDYTFTVEMRAYPRDKPTPVNLVQHTYWNLGGHDSGSILSETVQIFASHVTPVDDKFIPTGQIKSVVGTPFDFLKPRTVGSRIPKLGYDINYVVDPSDGKHDLRRVAVVKDRKTGSGFELLSNQPGVQFYTSNTLRATGKGGYEYEPYAALCLETQGFPNAVNQPNFPSQIVNPGEVYKHNMVFKFSIK